MTDTTSAPLQATGYPPGAGGLPPPPPPGGGGGGYAPPPPPPGGGGGGLPPPPPPGGGGFGGPPGGGFGGPPGGGPPGGGFGGPPGGFGGPPGGGPPGGFGGPPGGGPPGGGGGGPPGGFGGPPGGGPPGGFGGPPGGGPPGGFGGPPGGFGGPPGGGGGYGPPPGAQAFGAGYGPPPGPMGAPPKKSGPGVGLFIGIGCAALFVLAATAIGLGYYFTRKAAESLAGSLPTTTYPAGTTAAPTTSGELKAEIRDLRHFKGEFGKTRHFIGEIYNTGTASMGFPSAKVTLFDASSVAVDSGTCASLVRVLEPGEKVPCTFSVFKTDSFNTFKVDITPMKSFYRGELAKLDITDIKFTPKRGYNPHQLDGKITNKGAFKAKSVWAIVSLFGTDGKIVGADQTLIAGNDLDPGAGALFTAKVYNVADKPETYRVKAIGYSD